MLPRYALTLVEMQLGKPGGTLGTLSRGGEENGPLSEAELSCGGRKDIYERAETHEINCCGQMDDHAASSSEEKREE